MKCQPINQLNVIQLHHITNTMHTTHSIPQGETEDQPSDIRYASLNIHQGNGFGAENVQEIAFEVEAADTEEDQVS